MIKLFMQFLEKNNLFKKYFNKQKVKRYMNFTPSKLKKYFVRRKEIKSLLKEVRDGDLIVAKHHGGIILRGNVDWILRTEKGKNGVMMNVTSTHKTHEDYNSDIADSVSREQRMDRFKESGKHYVTYSDIISLRSTKKRRMKLMEELSNV